VASHKHEIQCNSIDQLHERIAKLEAVPPPEQPPAPAAPIQDPSERVPTTEEELNIVAKKLHKGGSNAPVRFSGSFFQIYKSMFVQWLKMKGFYGHLIKPLDATMTNNYWYMESKANTLHFLRNSLSKEVF
jgi:hypothetical protein